MNKKKKQHNRKRAKIRNKQFTEKVKKKKDLLNKLNNQRNT